MSLLLTLFILYVCQVVYSSPTAGTQQCTLSVPLSINTVDNDSRIDELRGQIDRIEARVIQDSRMELREQMDELKESVSTILTILNSTTSRPSTDIDTNEPSEYVSSPLLHSCDEVKATWPDSVSDYYLIADSTGHARHVYCNMENTCGDKEGGWMRVGYLNMSDPSEHCPPGFKLYEEKGIRACGRHYTSQGGSPCHSVRFPSYSISYTQVCGRVTGYQMGSPDAIWATTLHTPRTIHEPYADGVSITQGSQQDHIWTFMAALQENVFAFNGATQCPCAPNSPVTPQPFIGNDYFCESGNSGNWDHTTFHSDDPLWDGKQCGLVEKACCLSKGIPWFNKALQRPTTDYIELRVCGDSYTTDEDIPVGFYEIYVK